MKAIFNPEGKFRFVEGSEAEMRTAMDDGGGICTKCGEPAESFVEPDAKRYPCESCRARAVYGFELLMLMGRFRMTEATP